MFKKIILIIAVLILMGNFNSCLVSAITYEDLSLTQKIGQMMCLDFRFWNQKPFTEINPEIKEIIAKYHIGSIILFSQNFETKDQIKKLISDLQAAAKESGNPPLLICVDQEGGKVERFAFGRERLKNNSELKTEKEAFEKGQVIGKELKELGINCNLAPVVDVNSNPKNPIINVRSFSDKADIVSKFGKNFMEGLHSQIIISTAKHFPGHGDTDVDSHLGLPRINKSLEELECTELKPFETMINSNVDMIMTAHIELPQIEKNIITSKKSGKKFFVPATVSKTTLTDLLRNKMSFDGAIITDAMNMKAISDNFEEWEATKLAIKAGADIVLMPTILRSKSDVIKLDSIFENLKNAIISNEISEIQINESISRLLKLKENYCN